VDGYHVAFGKLIDGFDTLDKLESYGILEGCGAQKGRTTKTIRIDECGEITNY
jgi:cyclophilin family peptidyl-prolyl cis-trans isomerase